MVKRYPADGRYVPSDQIDIFHAVRVLWQRRLIVMLFTCAFIGAGFVYLKLTPPVYESKARVLVERRDVALDKRVQLRYEPEFIQTQAEIFRSRSIVENSLVPGMPSTVATAEDPISVVLDAITVTPVEGTYVMQIAYRSLDSEEAVTTLKALIKGYREYLRDSEKDTQLQTLTFLTENENRIRSELEEKEAAYRELRSRSALLVGQDAGRVHTDYLANLGRAVTDAKSRRLQLENQVEIWKKSPLLAETEKLDVNRIVQASFVDSSTENETQNAGATRYGDAFALPKTQKLDHITEIRTLQGQLNIAQSTERELDRVYGDSHPQLQDIRSQINEIQTRLNEMVAAIPRVFEDELEVVRLHEVELERLYNTEVKKAKELDVHKLEEQQISSNVERLRAVHDSILGEMRSRETASASAEMAHGLVHVKTISAARSTGNAVWPIPSVVLAVCGIVGLCVGATLAIIVESFSDSARTRRSGPDSDVFDPDEGFQIVDAETERRRQVANAR